MKNLLFYVGLFFKLLIDKIDGDELSFIIDDSGSNQVNTKIIKNICSMYLLFNKEIAIYQGKTINIIRDFKSLDSFIDTFKPRCKSFNLKYFLDLIPNRAYHIIYSDFYFDNDEIKLINDEYTGMLIGNDTNSSINKKIHKL